MLKRIFVLSFALIALIAAPAAAQTYATPGGTAVAGDSSIRVTGEGCPPNGEIAYSYTGAESGSGTATADASGDYDFTIDNLDAGTYQVTVQCGGETTVLSATVGARSATPGVTPGATAGGTGATATAGALPRTGTDTTTTLAQFGAAAVALGAVAIYGAKRRKAKAFA